MSVPPAVLSAYGFSSYRVEAVSGGLINLTYSVSDGDGNTIAAVQRQHPVFSPEVNLDIEAITEVLANAQLSTPRLLRTGDGHAFVRHQGHVWRACTWVQGVCYAKMPSPAIAEQAGNLVARFHRALSNLSYEFKFDRADVHDTAQHLRKLQNVQIDTTDVPRETYALRDEIIAQNDRLPVCPVGPKRIIHGDLKISNLLFTESQRGLCLVDLDTIGWGSIACELGDALRSWANPHGEDVANSEIDCDIIAAAARGYAAGAADLLLSTEVDSVIIGLETICLALAARFCLDIFEDQYFGWDKNQFKSRRQHNLVRARGQLSLSQSVARHRSSLQVAWTAPFTRSANVV